MIVWMRRHARELAGDLRASAAGALARGSSWALVGMAFFAVVREGIETAVFLLAAFQASGDAVSASAGPLLGIVCAIGVGWGIYGGGVHLNLNRFFRITSAALVLVAAGLVMSAFHTAHEAGWLNSLQASSVDLSWLVRPGFVLSSLLTGVLGLQPQPTVGEAAGWLIYALPMLAFVCWPAARSPKHAMRGATREDRQAHHGRGGDRRIGHDARRLRQQRVDERRADQADARGQPHRRRLRAREPEGESRLDHLQGHERRHREGQRARAEEPEGNHPRRAREHRLGDQRLLHAQPAARQVRPQLPERRHGGQRHGCRLRHGRLGDSAAPDRCSTKATDGYRSYVVGESDQLLAATRRLSPLCARATSRRRRPVRPDAVPLRGDRAGRRELRQPRPRDRRARQRRGQSVAVDGLPPDRADPLGQGNDRRHAGVRHEAAAGRDDTRPAGADAQLPAGAARERRRRAAERGRELEDHR